MGTQILGIFLFLFGLLLMATLIFFVFGLILLIVGIILFVAGGTRQVVYRPVYYAQPPVYFAPPQVPMPGAGAMGPTPPSQIMHRCRYCQTVYPESSPTCPSCGATF